MLFRSEGGVDEAALATVQGRVGGQQYRHRAGKRATHKGRMFGRKGGHFLHPVDDDRTGVRTGRHSGGETLGIAYDFEDFVIPSDGIATGLLDEVHRTLVPDWRKNAMRARNRFRVEIEQVAKSVCGHVPSSHPEARGSDSGVLG